MTTFYLDFEGGSDAANGLSFANRWRTITTGATAARIAPGDTIRIMASTDPTSVGDATWTGTGLYGTRSITSSTNATPIVVSVTSHGFSNGETVFITGHTTNTKANGMWTINNVATNSFELVGSVGNGAGGSTGTVQRRTSSVVTLATACTQNIAVFGNQGYKTNWTASGSVTCTITTSDFREGGECQQIAVAAGFATGKAAYYATGTLDLSGYQQVSFWIKQTSGTVAVSGDISLRLCTDTIGAVSVHTVTIPGLIALNRWCCFTVDLATNLNSAIASIALYVDVDRAAQTFLIDNIIACKDDTSNDSLSLNSVIGKNVSGETFWAIQSINGTRVVLDNAGTNTLLTSTTANRGYWGTTETVTTYKIQPIKLGPTVSAGDNNATTESGSAGNPITYIGGWNRTDMSTQTGVTWVDGINGLGTFMGNFNTITVEKICSTRFSTGFARGGTGVFTDCATANNTAFGFSTLSNATYTMTTCFAVQNGSGGFEFNAGVTSLLFTNLKALSNIGAGISVATSATYGTLTSGFFGSGLTASNGGSHGFRVTTTGGTSGQFYLENIETSYNSGTGFFVSVTNNVVQNVVINTITASTNSTSGIKLGGGTSSVALTCKITNFTCQDNTGYGIEVFRGYDNFLYNGTTSGNSTGGIFNDLGLLTCRNVSIAESTEFAAMTAGTDGIIRCEKHDGTTDNHRIILDGGLIVSSTAERHTASDFSWAMQPTSATRTANWPLVLAIAQIPVFAGTLVTATVWVYRTNTGITARLVCKGSQIKGVLSDVVDTASGSASTWEQLEVSFTPTEFGVVELTVEAYGGTTYTVYVDDFDWSQA